MQLFSRATIASAAVTAVVAVAGAVLVAAAPHAAGGSALRADLVGPDGTSAGSVRLVFDDDTTLVTANVTLPPTAAGFHGFHIHEKGDCTAPGFTSAGGHLDPAGATHHDHDGDLPVLLVRTDGRAEIRFRTDRLDVAELLDGDGSAVIIHQRPDNYANIPLRYSPAGPDATSLATGDAGSRIACGVLR